MPFLLYAQLVHAAFTAVANAACARLCLCAGSRHVLHAAVSYLRAGFPPQNRAPCRCRR